MIMRIVGSVLAGILLASCGGGGGGDGPGGLGNAPSAPSGLVASARAGAVSLSWAAVPGAASYNLYWSQTAGVTTTNGTKIAGVTSAHLHSGLTNGSTYYYVVTAVNAYGESAASAPASATPTYTITGRVVIGAPVQGATVTAYALNANGTRGAALAAGVIADALGGFSITLATAPAAPILIEAAGGSYVDEVTGAAVTLPVTELLYAAVPVGVTRVAITPLTTMAAARAKALAAGGTPLVTAVAAANARVGQHFAVADILGLIPPAANNALQVATASIDERAYALVLAGLAQEAGTIYFDRTMDVVIALASDLSDGLFDGQVNGATIQFPTSGNLMTQFPTTAATTTLQSAIDAFAASAVNATGLTAHSVPATALAVGTSGPSGFYATTTALPAWISGRAGSVPIGASGGTAPYSCTQVGGTLPGWMTLTASPCTLSGTAPILPAGTTRSVLAPLTLSLADSAAATQVVVLVPSIVQAAPVLTLVNPAPAATVGVAYSQSLVASVSGGSAPYSYRSDSFANGAPPIGMGIDLNGRLVGTPGVAGTYVFGVCAVDLVGGSVCGTTSITVHPSTTGVTAVNTYTGPFNGSGNFTRNYGVTVCSFYNTFSGTITVVSTTGGATPGTTSHVQGNWTSKATGGSIPGFTCLDSSTAWENSPAVTVSGATVSFTSQFVTPAGSTVSNAFTGTLGATSIAGSLVSTFDTSAGTATMPVTLTKQ